MTWFNTFYILKTTNSEVHRVTLFTSRHTKYIPDFFFLLCSATLFFVAQTFDKVFMFLVVIYGGPLYLAFLIAPFLAAPLICSFFLERSSESVSPDLAKKNWLIIVSMLTGCGPFLICGSIWRKIFECEIELNIPMKCYSFPVFHISKNDMSFVKMYYLFNAVFKCIPQMYLVSGLILGKYLEGSLAILGQVSLTLNVVMFSLTMAVTFPLRSTPRVYTDSFWVLLNAFSKLMASVCGCGVNLLTVTILFTSIGYQAFLVHFVRLFFWIWPTVSVLRSQPQHLGSCFFTFYLFFLTLIFNTIYIHPFEGKGKLIYYSFYLVKFFTELFSIYVFTNTSVDTLLLYLTLKSVMVGYLCCYGLVNILHKYKEDKGGCEVYLETINDEEKGENSNSEGPKNEKMQRRSNPAKFKKKTKTRDSFKILTFKK